MTIATIYYHHSLQKIAVLTLLSIGQKIKQYLCMHSVCSMPIVRIFDLVVVSARTMCYVLAIYDNQPSLSDLWLYDESIAHLTGMDI